ncbi:TetR family transcriptional regulator [Tersicoccus solisilvae]|uniref:TetR family transcriptional regulator n=1 Tax=Tersicoccus solisilvae TaxID=1882339 RepID=A0ABQ1NN89_9MICC|nr:TetR/AcrR family transcriptional regulator [Tersicoccus solisilvae]GGC79341.1 TetR family transcriptional regulator [Tersicoccus solisilvae]
MPRNGAINRERILATAEHLVIEKGFAATALDEVIEGAGTSKGAFFHHFPTKLDLAKALVDRYVTADLGQLQNALSETAHLAADPRARLLAFLRIFEDGADELMSEQSSCLYVSTVVERDLLTAGTADRIVDAVVGWREPVAGLIRAAVEAHAGHERGDDETNDDGNADGVDADALADHLFVTFEGAFVLCRATGDAGHMRAQLRVLRQLVDHLVR